MTRTAVALLFIGAVGAAQDLPPDHPPTDAPDKAAPHGMDLRRLLEEVEAKGDELKKKPKSFEIAYSFANLYFENGRYDEAIAYWDEAASKPDAAGKVTADLYTRRGTARFLLGQTSAAVADLEKALARWPEDPDALYLYGAFLFDAYGEDKARLKKAKEAWTKFVAQVPDSQHADRVRRKMAQLDEAIAKGGVSKAKPLPDETALAIPASAPPQPEPPAPDVGPISPEMAEAVANTPRTKELEEGLAKNVELGEAHLAAGRFTEAAQAYRSVLPYQPENGRAAAGMAAAMIGLGRPSADRVFAAAAGKDPAAVEALAARLEKAGNADLARKLRERLAGR